MECRYGVLAMAAYGFAPEVCEALINYDWPGNIRELKNVIEACLAIEQDSLIGMEGISRLMNLEGQSVADVSDSQGLQYSEALEKFEHRYFAEILRQCGNNVELAAKKAEVNIATLYRKIKKYNLREN